MHGVAAPVPPLRLLACCCSGDWLVRFTQRSRPRQQVAWIR